MTGNNNLLVINMYIRSGSFCQNYSDVGLFTISLLAHRVLHMATGLPMSMSHRATCEWSQVHVVPGHSNYQIGLNWTKSDQTGVNKIKSEIPIIKIRTIL